MSQMGRKEEVGRCWHRLPRGAVGAPALGVFKVGQGFEESGLVEGVPPWQKGGTK